MSLIILGDHFCITSREEEEEERRDTGVSEEAMVTWAQDAG